MRVCQAHTLTPLGCLSFLCFLINHPSGLKNTLDSPESGSKPMEINPVRFFLRRSMKPGGLQGAAPGLGCLCSLRRCPGASPDVSRSWGQTEPPSSPRARVGLCLLSIDVLLSAEVSGLPGGDRLDCVKASDQCLKEQSCSTKFRTLRQCVAGKESNFSRATGLEAKDECRSAMEALKQKSLYNCRCKRGMKKEKNCLRIYWSMYQSLQGTWRGAEPPVPGAGSARGSGRARSCRPDLPPPRPPSARPGTAAAPCPGWKHGHSSLQGTN